MIRSDLSKPITELTAKEVLERLRNKDKSPEPYRAIYSQKDIAKAKRVLTRLLADMNRESAEVLTIKEVVRESHE